MTAGIGILERGADLHRLLPPRQRAHRCGSGFRRGPVAGQHARPFRLVVHFGRAQSQEHLPHVPGCRRAAPPGSDVHHERRQGGVPGVPHAASRPRVVLTTLAWAWVGVPFPYGLYQLLVKIQPCSAADPCLTAVLGGWSHPEDRGQTCALDRFSLMRPLRRAPQRLRTCVSGTVDGSRLGAGGNGSGGWTAVDETGVGTGGNGVDSTAEAAVDGSGVGTGGEGTATGDGNRAGAAGKAHGGVQRADDQSVRGRCRCRCRCGGHGRAHAEDESGQAGARDHEQVPYSHSRFFTTRGCADGCPSTCR